MGGEEGWEICPQMTQMITDVQRINFLIFPLIICVHLRHLWTNLPPSSLRVSVDIGSFQPALPEGLGLPVEAEDRGAFGAFGQVDPADALAHPVEEVAARPLAH